MSPSKILHYFFAVSFFTSMVIIAALENEQEHFVTFPPKDVLEESLRSRMSTGFEIADFLKIADEKLTPEQVYDKVSALCSAWFVKFVDDNHTERLGSRHVLGISDLSKRHKSRFVHLLLQNDPKALEMLKALKSDLDEERNRPRSHRC